MEREAALNQVQGNPFKAAQHKNHPDHRGKPGKKPKQHQFNPIVFNGIQPTSWLSGWSNTTNILFLALITNSNPHIQRHFYPAGLCHWEDVWLPIFNTKQELKWMQNPAAWVQQGDLLNVTNEQSMFMGDSLLPLGGCTAQHSTARGRGSWWYKTHRDPVSL